MRARNRFVSRHGRSRKAEAFRILRTNITSLDRPPKTILITSAMPQEARSTIVCDLAIVLAAVGKSVLLVDADLRNPTLAGRIGLIPPTGLTNIVNDRIPLEDAVQRWDLNGVDVLAAGPNAPNETELLAGPSVRHLVQQARERYDFVLIDAPPVLPFADASLVATTVDGVILVCRYGRTTRAQLMSAMAALSMVSARVLGTVLSAAPRKIADRGRSLLPVPTDIDGSGTGKASGPTTVSPMRPMTENSRQAVASETSNTDAPTDNRVVGPPTVPGRQPPRAQPDPRPQPHQRSRA
jgi:capsular exopolysaccharide synthesis family protein